MSFLSETLTCTKLAVESRQRERSIEDVKANMPARSEERVFLKTLRSEGISVISEFKRRWPSAIKQELQLNPDLSEIVRAYEKAGASAVSVLTEVHKFGGSYKDLRMAREACTLPILDKDFIIDPYQVYEAAEAGADAILLIGAALKDDPGQLGRLHDLAREARLDVLVEVRNDEELERALAVDADLIGINNRDLDTLEIDRETTRRLAARIPANVTIVSESGFRTAKDLADLDDRVDAVLIGAALMTAPDTEEMCRELTRAGAEIGVAKSGESAHPAFA